MASTKLLLHGGISLVTPELWAKCVDHVIRKVEPGMLGPMNNVVIPHIDPIIIHFGGDDSDSEEEF